MHSVPRSTVGATTEQRIAAQREIVASLVPGCPQHELAVRVLLLLQDSMHLMQEIDALMRQAQKLRDHPPG